MKWYYNGTKNWKLNEKKALSVNRWDEIALRGNEIWWVNFQYLRNLQIAFAKTMHKVNHWESRNQGKTKEWMRVIRKLDKIEKRINPNSFSSIFYHSSFTFIEFFSFVHLRTLFSFCHKFSIIEKNANPCFSLLFPTKCLKTSYVL